MSASKTVLLTTVVGLAIWALANSCRAQELRRYQPSTATVSPYLNLGRFNNGGLPNYYALVRPQNQQRQINLQAQRLQRQQGAALQQLQHIAQQGRVEQAVTGTGSRFMTQGSRSFYRETLQFYPVVNLRR